MLKKFRFLIIIKEGDITMETITFNPDSLVDLVRVLRYILRRIMLIDIYVCSSDSYMTHVVSNKKLIRYEKGSKHYKLVYENSYRILDSRTAKKLLTSRDMIGFVTLNERDVVNVNYIVTVDGNAVRLAPDGTTIPVSRKGRQSLENYIHFW